ncbi:hypothetical protein BHM03_00017458 [Ensete ventricosum]|uniref:Uncharacterized protein n=1 Tax=Ensete ventricosum TaxID=4639 RepID=A0A445MF38_ENSVE|nr:hypothetical protein BHM03_00017458 [Ensete ventricosum]
MWVPLLNPGGTEPVAVKKSARIARSSIQIVPVRSLLHQQTASRLRHNHHCHLSLSLSLSLYKLSSTSVERNQETPQEETALSKQSAAQLHRRQGPSCIACCHAVRWDHGCRHPTKTPIDCSTPVKSFNDFAAAERRSEEDSKEGGLPARIPQSGIASSHHLAVLP